MQPNYSICEPILLKRKRLFPKFIITYNYNNLNEIMHNAVYSDTIPSYLFNECIVAIFKVKQK